MGSGSVFSRLLLRRFFAGDCESIIRAVVEFPLEPRSRLAGGVDLETDGPASVVGRVLNLDGELDRGAVLFAQLFTRPLLELVPAVQQAALRVNFPVDAPVLRHQVPRLDGPAENGRHHVPLFVVRLPVQLGHPPLPLVARKIRPGRRQRVQLALHTTGHRQGIAVLARHRRRGHFDLVLAEQRVFSGRPNVVHDHRPDQQQYGARRLRIRIVSPHVGHKCLLSLVGKKKFNLESIICYGMLLFRRAY